MRRNDISFVAALFLVAILKVGVAADKESPAGSSGGPGAGPPTAPIGKGWIVQLTEFRVKGTLDPKVSTEEMIQSLEKSKADMVETVRLSALEGHESMVTFGRTTAMAVGSVNAGPGRPISRQYQHRDLGTMVRVTATSHDGKIVLKLSYQASRLGAEAKDDAPPEVKNVQFNTTLQLEPGKPTLVGGGATSEAASVLLVSIK